MIVTETWCTLCGKVLRTPKEIADHEKYSHNGSIAITSVSTKEGGR